MHQLTELSQYCFQTDVGQRYLNKIHDQARTYCPSVKDLHSTESLKKLPSPIKRAILTA